MTKDYWVDFQASIKVKASSSKEAKKLAIAILEDIGSTHDFYDSKLCYLEINTIEEIEK